MGRVAAADGAQDAPQPGVRPAAGARPKRAARDTRERLPAQRPPRRAGRRPLRGARWRAVAPSSKPIRTARQRSSARRSRSGGARRSPTLPTSAFAQAEIARLEERRWAAFEARVDAELALGRHADLVSELEAAVAEQPLRERLHGQLMLALYRCGRQAEALEAYRRARRTLVEEIGVEPGAELRALQEAILAQDPALDAPPGPEELPAALDGGSPVLAGRDRELAELIALLADACEGRGGVVLVSGPRGIGKTRLAAELAREALRRRMAVRLHGARTPPADALAAIRRAEESERPTLLIVDDADEQSGEAARSRGCARPRQRATGDCCSSCLHRGREPPAAFARPGGTLELGPLGDEAIAEIARLYLPAGIESAPDPGARGGERRRASCRASRGGGVGAGAGLAGGWSERRPRGRRARRAARRRGRPLRRPARSPDGRRARPALRRRGGRRAAAGGLPVPRPRHLRRRSRGVLLRSRAARGRAGRPARGLAPARRGRTVGEREVLGGAGRPAAGARERRAARAPSAGAGR